jgi:hypothetical protein
VFGEAFTMNDACKRQLSRPDDRSKVAKHIKENARGQQQGINAFAGIMDILLVQTSRLGENIRFRETLVPDTAL